MADRLALERGLLTAMQPNDVRAFQKRWYGATEESREIQCAMAVEKLRDGIRRFYADARKLEQYAQARLEKN